MQNSPLFFERFLRNFQIKLETQLGRSKPLALPDVVRTSNNRQLQFLNRIFIISFIELLLFAYAYLSLYSSNFKITDSKEDQRIEDDWFKKTLAELKSGTFVLEDISSGQQFKDCRQAIVEKAVE